MTIPPSQWLTVITLFSKQYDFMLFHNNKTNIFYVCEYKRNGIKFLSIYY
jgi:hypothetical protein